MPTLSDVGHDLLKLEGEICRDDDEVNLPSSFIASCIDLGRQLVLFTLVGAFGTLAHYALLIILVELVGIDAVIASMAGALLGAAVNYILNYRFTFNSRASHRIAVPKFLAVATIGFILNALLMWVVINFAKLHYLLGQVITTGLVLLWNFLGNRYWTFGEDKHDAAR